MTAKMRDEFERVVGSPWDDSIQLRSLWEEAWKASREAIEIEIPEAGYDCEDMTYAEGMEDMRRDVVDAVEAAGIRVKPC